MPRAPRVLLTAAAVLLAAGVLALAAAGPGYDAGYLSLAGSFRLVAAAVAGQLLGALLALTALRWRRMLTRSAWLALGAILAGTVIAAAVPAGWARTGRTVPPIHDITTDTDDPPLFVDVLPLRRGAMNPPEYDGPEVAAQQRAAWPDLGPLETPVDRARVHAAVRAAMTRAGWAIVGDDEAEGRLEAVATTRWFRFKDDIVVRLRAAARGGTRVDMRSKSRIGRSDLGTNARRIRTFLDDLRRTLEAMR
ncbi:hypothetical protein TBR22_A36120 [Luteitalea sp. TBR-22]|uniref:DUF1499 domain-containing protein n=1 Tax=Luteitalea sp. TBR-22 TaxID=2802971 RepID=UPI001AFA372D|nr:DUF1499 domain-containing protein [Luteitalea sp. TBR-22]BCS34382.1 hypothetical protein TBR22_A36120 [Luteitalea sp. TBR-22]